MWLGIAPSSPAEKPAISHTTAFSPLIATTRVLEELPCILIIKITRSWEWWQTSALLVLGGKRENHGEVAAKLGYFHNEFQTSLDSTVSEETTNK